MHLKVTFSFGSHDGTKSFKKSIGFCFGGKKDTVLSLINLNLLLKLNTSIEDSVSGSSQKNFTHFSIPFSFLLSQFCKLNEQENQSFRV